ncbi:MAG: Hpt domain-containing protein [Alphaproteobacteria bacterium]|jgi:HPt (histidine-containing phosphotransfer) domain-containing protein|uniref:Transcriptional regulator n=2 Tax=Rhizobium/Agrobacterium group TaxID=227290 RepID=A0A922TCM6_9HYPH|nr:MULTISPECIES: Hpt domain-containing protein [Pseudorhizobium]MBU1315617.1 Hpt domain-containing protein [Alphaproteobacteria bacterium]MDY6960588.1 Hpt domain-containing protein [Pseudomonadota bacterium]KEQ06017.1 transcriptional regulator [Pseudorhizobium pelagicum]KEQ11132.1 transcriptional regulator [Pseudorhizobium pelagicum]MBU1550948.1 Hpt domain-containing protein [Alphaproteobacteria bacterium]|tara:strand:- start:1753 stop:2121 length:369 start_codon:yes stop_codon:yes gene_type:complete
MAALSIAFEAPVTLRGLSPSQSRPIDLVHLAAQTLGDKGREIDALQAFVRQARQALRDVANGDAAGITAAAHRLQGAAAGVGAFKVADAAARLEENGADAAAMAKLGAAVLETENFVLKLCR